MEVLSELLWRLCSWGLLCFLAERFISLIVCVSEDDDSVSGLIKEKGVKVKHSSIVDGHEFDGGFLQKDGVFSKQKRVEFQKVDFNDEFSCGKKFVDSSKKEDDEVNLFNEFFHDLMKELHEYNEKIEENSWVKNNEEDEGGVFGEGLVDHIEEEEEERKIVGFEDEFGGKLESGDNNVDDHIKDGECQEIDVDLGSRKIEDEERKGENSSNVDRGESSGREFNKNEGVLSDDEDWEGIERSELEKRFAEAMNLMDKEGKLVKRGNDVNMQLYGLQKVAMEGPCYEPQPMALKLNARAKWNAWQRLGNMTREDAMEQYINLLSDNTSKGVEDDHSSVSDLKVAEKSSSSETAVDSYPGAN